MFFVLEIIQATFVIVPIVDLPTSAENAMVSSLDIFLLRVYANRVLAGHPVSCLHEVMHVLARMCVCVCAVWVLVVVPNHCHS